MIPSDNKILHGYLTRPRQFRHLIVFSCKCQPEVLKLNHGIFQMGFLPIEYTSLELKLHIYKIQVYFSALPL